MTTIYTAKRGRRSEKKILITDDIIFDWEIIRSEKNIPLTALPVSNVTYKKAYYSRKITENTFNKLKEFFENQKNQ